MFCLTGERRAGLSDGCFLRPIHPVGPGGGWSEAVLLAPCLAGGAAGTAHVMRALAGLAPAAAGTGRVKRPPCAPSEG